MNFVGQPGTPQSQQLSVTNSGRSTERVQLTTRALTREVSDSGVQTFTMDPSSLTANSGTIPIWSGITEAFQTETFNVPRTDPRTPSRLLFSADYQFTGQGSLLHVALSNRTGRTPTTPTLRVWPTSPRWKWPTSAGRWTAVFFTELDEATGPRTLGTRGPIQWDAQTWQYTPAGSITPSFLAIPPGQTATATLSLTTPTASGDTDQSVVVSSNEGQRPSP